MGIDNYFVWFTDATTQLLTNHSDVFQTAGLHMFKGFAIIVLVWFGLQTALRGGFRMDRFASLLLTIAFGFGMITFYANPIPGIGKSFHSLISDEGIDLSETIEANSEEDVAKKLADVYEKMDGPKGTDMLDIAQVVRYYAIVLILSLAQGAILAVITLGFVAAAVCILIGPIFISFFIVPNLDFLFWNWLKAFIQYSFYPVIGNAFVYVYGELMLHFMDVHPGPWNAQTIAALFLQVLLLGIAFIWGILRVPAITSSIFAGSSGSHALPGFRGWR